MLKVEGVRCLKLYTILIFNGQHKYTKNNPMVLNENKWRMN